MPSSSSATLGSLPAASPPSTAVAPGRSLVRQEEVLDDPSLLKSTDALAYGRAVVAETLQVLDYLEQLEPAVIVYGTARKELAEAQAVGTVVAQLGDVSLRTGAGPGAMGASAQAFVTERDRLAQEGAGTTAPGGGSSQVSQGVKIGFTAGQMAFEQHVDPSVETVLVTPTFFARKLMELNSALHVVLEGGFGTIDEFLEAAGWRLDRHMEEDLVFYSAGDFYQRLLEVFAQYTVLPKQMFADSYLVPSADQVARIYRQRPRGAPSIDLPTVRRELVSELTAGFEAVANLEPAVAFFGAAEYPEGDRSGELLSQLAQKLTQQGKHLRVTDQGATAEAVVAGARASDASATVQAFTSAHEPPSSLPGLSVAHAFDYFIAQREVATTKTQALVFGTADLEALGTLYSILTLFQTHKLARQPVVLLGTEKWGPLWELTTELMIAAGTISPADKDLVTVTDDVDLAARLILEHSPPEPRDEPPVVPTAEVVAAAG